MESLLLRRIDLRVGHRPEHVDHRLGEGSERREGLLAVLRVAREAHQAEDHELAVSLLGHERQGRRRHHVRDRRELPGRGIGQGDEALDRLGRRGKHEHPADDHVELVEAEPEPRRDAEVPAAAPDRPEQVRVGVLVGVQELAVRRDDLGREQVVDREPVLADEVPDAPAERDPPDADRARVAETDAESVGHGVVREPGGGEARLGPRGAVLDVDVDHVHLGEIEDDPVGHAVAGDAVATAPDGELDPALTRQPDHGRDVGRVGHAGDEGGFAVEPAVEGRAGLVVRLVPRGDHAALQSRSKFRRSGIRQW